MCFYLIGWGDPYTTTTLFVQDHIDAYMATCRTRSKSASSSSCVFDVGDAVETSWDNEDAQTQEDFEQFKLWLASQAPEPSSGSDGSATVVVCKSCNKNPCILQ